MGKINAILLLDSISKRVIKTSVSEFGSKDVIIINSFNEITNELASTCKTVIVFESYFQNIDSYSTLRLFKSLFDLDLIFLGGDTKILDTLSIYGNTFVCDFINLDYKMLQSAIFQEEPASTSGNLVAYRSSARYAKDIVNSSELFDRDIVELAKCFINEHDELQAMQTKLQGIIRNYGILQDTNAKLSIENDALTTQFSKMMENALTLNKRLEEYERILTKDIYSKLSLLNYSNKPTVIYLKEIEALNHENSFVEVLFEMLRMQGRQSVKVLRLYDSNNCRQVKALPNYYKVIRNSFLVSDVVTNNFLVKVGDYSEILDILLTNKAGLDTLVIVDCKSFDDTVLSGAPLQFNLCSNRRHVSAYDLNMENTIVNGDEDDKLLVWGEYEEVKDLTSKEELFLFLSSRPVMQTIFSLYQYIINSV